MIIEKGSDYVLRIKDSRGNGIRVANKPSFFIKVFTSNKSNYLEFSKDEVVERNDFDTISIPADKLAELESGVIAYTYGWGIADDNFEDGEYNRQKTIYTNDYFRNGETPSKNPSTSSTSSDLKEIKESIVDLTDRLNKHTIEVQDTTLKINI